MPTYNYPDLLGYLTGGERLNVGDVQVAMVTRPRVVRAGQPFEVIMVIQSTVDVPVDVIVNLHLPEKDAAGKKARFVSGTPRLVVGLEPGEAGYVTLPVSTMADTAIGRGYKISMDIAAKTPDKGTPVRNPEGGGMFDPDSLNESQRTKLDSLKSLHFVTQARRGLRRGTSLEVSFAVLSGKVGKMVDLKPGWVSLWTLEGSNSDALLLEKYAEMLRLRTLPKLTRNRCAPILQDKVEERFKKAGYPLTLIEATLISRLLTLILEYANASRTGHGSTSGGIYNIGARVAEKQVIPDDVVYSPLPHWVGTFLVAVSRDERIGAVPHKAIPHFAFNDLLRDGITYAFQQIIIATGEDLGDEEEIAQYADNLIEKLDKKGQIDFMQAYLPLVIGGVLAFDQVLLSSEKLPELLHEIRVMLQAREQERTSDNEVIFDMADTIIQQTIKKYGYIDKT